jgi:hypothetical protein
VKTACRLVVVAALSMFGLFGASSTASATARPSAIAASSADCASLSQQAGWGTTIWYWVKNQCAVGVRMNALLADGDSSGCMSYDPGQTLEFSHAGDYTYVQDVVYC